MRFLEFEVLTAHTVQSLDFDLLFTTEEHSAIHLDVAMRRYAARAVKLERIIFKILHHIYSIADPHRMNQELICGLPFSSLKQ